MLRATAHHGIFRRSAVVPRDARPQASPRRCYAQIEERLLGLLRDGLANPRITAPRRSPDFWSCDTGHLRDLALAPAGRFRLRGHHPGCHASSSTRTACDGARRWQQRSRSAAIAGPTAPLVGPAGALQPQPSQRLGAERRDFLWLLLRARGGVRGDARDGARGHVRGDVADEAANETVCASAVS